MLLYDNHFVDSVVYNGNQVDVVNCNGEQILPERVLMFVSDNPFTVGNKNNMTGFCDGTLEVKSGNGNWTSWDGSTTITASMISNKYIVSFRGIGNTYFYKSNSAYLNFVLTGSNIELYGSCNYLLEYTREITTLPTCTVDEGTFRELFKNCTALVSIPEGFLPATTLAYGCYNGMFYGCSGLTILPSDLLPASTLTEQCYTEMFSNCSGLTTIPSGLLPATTLASSCYSNMFGYCTGLITLPANLLPATTLVNNCYAGMFIHCISLRLSNTQTATYNKKVVQFGTVSFSSVNGMFVEIPNVSGQPTNNSTYWSA